MRENRDFVVPVNILTTFARAPFSWAARHTTVCLDQDLFKVSLGQLQCLCYVPLFVQMCDCKYYVAREQYSIRKAS